MRRHIPNALSISRIGMSLVVLVAAVNMDRGTFILVAVVVVVAIATDWADGYLARRWNVSSDVGYVLDAMGDRAIHLALTLIVLIRYQINPVFVWLLIFRDILIYAIRVISSDWLTRSRRIQWISRLHATNLRVWLCSYFLRDGLRLFRGSDPLDGLAFEVSQTALLCITIALSYWGIGKSLQWIIETDPPASTSTASQK